MALYADTLGLVAARHARRPLRALPVLDQLFRRLRRCAGPDEAIAVEDRIWDLWMYHPNQAARDILHRAADDIAARRYDIAETRLTRLLRLVPDYAEAWNKRATLYYLLGNDVDCVHDLRQVMVREPRHFGALCSFAEILLADGDRASACYAFAAAVTLHPNLARARSVLAETGTRTDRI